MKTLKTYGTVYAKRGYVLLSTPPEVHNAMLSANAARNLAEQLLDAAGQVENPQVAAHHDCVA